ncbi:14061_t:CDS:2, partial [Funneliformis geosporum]
MEGGVIRRHKISYLGELMHDNDDVEDCSLVAKYSHTFWRSSRKNTNPARQRPAFGLRTHTGSAAALRQYFVVRDGNASVAFHQECDNKGANIVVIKIKGTEQIVGGYNPFGWEGDFQWKHTLDSFVFSFVNSTNLQTAK